MVDYRRTSGDSLSLGHKSLSLQALLQGVPILFWAFGILIIMLVASEIVMWRAVKGTEEIGRRDAAILLMAAPMGGLYALLVFPWNPGADFPEVWESIGTVVGSLTMFGGCLHAARKIRRDGGLTYSAFQHVGNLMALTTGFCFVLIIIHLTIESI